jgi:hypothetical protein
MKGFISYAHEDHQMFGEFRPHLRSVEIAYGLDLWADTSLRAGLHWDATIQQAIEAAELYILLISPTFIASDYIYQHEIPAIRQRARLTDALVFPVVLSRCFWKLVCDELQGVPTDKGSLKPIADWRPRQQGYDRARAQIADAIETHCHLTPKTIGWTRP